MIHHKAMIMPIGKMLPTTTATAEPNRELVLAAVAGEVELIEPTKTAEMIRAHPYVNVITNVEITVIIAPESAVQPNQAAANTTATDANHVTTTTVIVIPV